MTRSPNELTHPDARAMIELASVIMNALTRITLDSSSRKSHRGRRSRSSTWRAILPRMEAGTEAVSYLLSRTSDARFVSTSSTRTSLRSVA